MSNNLIREEENKIKNRCPYCNHVNKNNIEMKTIELIYEVYGKIISYDSKWIPCEKCGRKVFLSNLYPECNDFIKLLVSAYLNDEDTTKKYIKKINEKLCNHINFIDANYEEIFNLSFSENFDTISVRVNNLLEIIQVIKKEKETRLLYFKDYPDKINTVTIEHDNKLLSEEKRNKNCYCISSCFDFLEFVIYCTPLTKA